MPRVAKSKSSKRSVSYRKRSYSAPRRAYYGGRGAYFLAGQGMVKGSLGPVKGGLQVQGGWSKHGETIIPVIPEVKGLGAYSTEMIKHNVLIKPDVPEIRNAKYREGGTIIRHREYLGPVYSSATPGDFKIDSYALQPAQKRSFPWLAKLASSYEEYTPNGIMYEFKSTCSDAIASSSNLALGQIMLATQYDSTDAPFASDIEMLNYSWAQSGKVSDCVVHFIECASNQSPLTHLYTRLVDVEPLSDSLRFTDFGRFSIASQGLQGTSVNLGQLWVTYEFIFFKPKIPLSIQADIQFFHYSNSYASTLMSVDYPLGQNIANGSLDPNNNLDVTLSYNGGTGTAYINFPAISDPTTYEVLINYTGGTTGSVIYPTFTVTSGGNAINFVASNTVNEIRYPNITPGTSSGLGAVVFWDPYPDGTTQAQLAYTIPAIPTNAYVDVYIIQVPYHAP